MTPKIDATASATIVRGPIRTAFAVALMTRPRVNTPAAAQLVDGEPRLRREDLRDLRRERGRRDDHVGGRAVGDDLAFGHHHDAVRGSRRRTRRRGSRPRSRDRRPASSRRIARELALGAVVEAARRLVEQHDPRRRRELHREHERESLSFGEVTRMRVVGDAGREPVERSRARARRRVRLGVGLRELLADGVEVEQVGRRLRHEPDERARLASGARSAGSRPPTSTRPPWRAPGALQRPEQRRLARAVAAHERDDLARAQLEVDVAHRDDRAVAHDDPAAAQHARRPTSIGCGTAGGGVDAGERRRAAVRRARRGVAHRQRQRRPTREPAELDDRRRDARAREQLGRARRARRVPSPGTCTIRSAYCTTRSSRCSAITTVTPRSCTSRVIARAPLRRRSGRAPRSARRARAPSGAR